MKVMKKFLMVLGIVGLISGKAMSVDIETLVPTITGIWTYTAVPVLNGGLDLNENLDMDLNANDESFNLTCSTSDMTLATIYCSDSAIDDVTALLGLDYAENSDASGLFVRCRDNSAADTVFSVGEDGNIIGAGTLALAGIATFDVQSVHTLGLDVNNSIDVDLPADSDSVAITLAVEKNAAGEAMILANCSDADVDTQMWLLELNYTDTADPDADFLVCSDGGGDKFSVDYAGNVAAAGTLGVAGIATFDLQSVHTLGLDVNNSIDIDLPADSDDVVITMAVEADTTGEPVVMINNTDSGLDTQTFLLELQYTEDGSAHGDFLTCTDAAGTNKFSIQEEGNTLIVGTLGVTGAITGTAQTVHTAGIDSNAGIDVDMAVDTDAVDITHAVEVDTAGDAVLAVRCTDTTVDTQQWLLELAYTEDGAANGDFLACSDAAGTDLFTISQDGDTSTEGDLAVTGDTVITGSITGNGGVATATATVSGTYPIVFATDGDPTSTPSAAGILMIDTANDCELYISTGTSAKAWEKVGAQ